MHKDLAAQRLHTELGKKVLMFRSMTSGWNCIYLSAIKPIQITRKKISAYMVLTISIAENSKTPFSICM